MRFNYRFAAPLALLMLIAPVSSGCSTPFGERVTGAFTAFRAASDLTVDPKYVVIAANISLALQATAKNYLRLKRCPINEPVCRLPEATPEIVKGVQAMRKARNDAQTFVKTHPGQLGPAGLYDALQTSIASVQEIYTKYDVINVTAKASAK